MHMHIAQLYELKHTVRYLYPKTETMAEMLPIKSAPCGETSKLQTDPIATPPVYINDGASGVSIEYVLRSFCRTYLLVLSSVYEPCLFYDDDLQWQTLQKCKLKRYRYQ